MHWKGMETNLFEINKKPQEYYSDRGDMIKYVPDTVNTLLDFGCGEGLFGHTLKQKRNIVVWGVELFEKEANKAKDKLDRVLVGNIELNHLDLPDDYFDCVAFNDVLEHLQYPWIVLNKIKKYLKKGGYVIASIPNIRYYEVVKKLLLNKEWEYEDSGVMDKTHLRFFTIKSIRKMFEKCGYTVATLEGIEFVEFPWKFNILNKLLFNKIDDMRYTQFACIARYL